MSRYEGNLVRTQGATQCGLWMQEKYRDLIYQAMDIGPKDRVLDIGAYQGWIYDRMSNKSNYWAVDNGAKVVNGLIAKVGDRDRVRQMTMPGPVSNLGTFDRVMCIHFLEHLLPDDAFRTCEQIVRALSNDGTVTIVVPDCIALGWRFNFSEWQHQFWTNEMNVRHLLQDAGLKVIHHASLCGPVQGVLLSHLVGMVMGVIQSKWLPLGRMLRMWPNLTTVDRLNKMIGLLSISHLFVAGRQ